MKLLFALIYIFSLAVSAFSIPLENIITNDQIARILSSDHYQLFSAQLTNPYPSLMPNYGDIHKSVMGIMNTLKPNILVEALYLYRKPAKSKTDSAVWDEKQKITVFNQITAISTLTGIQYYSSSRRAMRTFYEYSSIIDSPATKKPLSDPVFTQIPASLTVFARQKDLTFGDNIYRYDYENRRDAVFFTQENITSLNYGIIPVIGKGNLRSVMAVFDGGDTILIYVASMAKAASIPGFSDKISSSFTNRAQAIIQWFSDRLYKEL
ncbi:DUF6675 family protein [Treponema sp. R80B11-R83G3]